MDGQGLTMVYVDSDRDFCAQVGLGKMPVMFKLPVQPSKQPFTIVLAIKSSLQNTTGGL